METEAIADMHTERRKIVDDRRTYESSVRSKKQATTDRWRKERITADSIARALSKSCCQKDCLRCEANVVLTFKPADRPRHAFRMITNRPSVGGLQNFEQGLV